MQFLYFISEKGIDLVLTYSLGSINKNDYSSFFLLE